MPRHPFQGAHVVLDMLDDIHRHDHIVALVEIERDGLRHDVADFGQLAQRIDPNGADLDDIDCAELGQSRNVLSDPGADFEQLEIFSVARRFADHRPCEPAAAGLKPGLAFALIVSVGLGVHCSPCPSPEPELTRSQTCRMMALKSRQRNRRVSHIP